MKEVKVLMKEVDLDGNGTVDLDEFTKLMRKKLKARNTVEEFMRVFRIYDEDDSGKIDLDDLKRINDEMKIGLTDDQLRGMIEEADKDRDGSVS
eukprot:CAMPEP_0202962766 /NCGR_PEP_ID=MMETSP1396-20130829/6827_1 /ASSEMBLY_ACC=CAM_ASM_000872 /TAXON_ID= /ORGANISM="Pseudokeronopsis sp., Strain Brazil" /LENGTH=93 /DNA_ID=CAMNT_0049683523 /DNA_START=288 /DNA_END=569 /DNA_ORIENTATION=+